MLIVTYFSLLTFYIQGIIMNKNYHNYLYSKEEKLLDLILDIECALDFITELLKEDKEIKLATDKVINLLSCLSKEITYGIENLDS